KVSMTITRPDTSVGTLLSNVGLGAWAVIDADLTPTRQATLQAIEASTGKPVASYTEASVDFSAESEDNGGLFEGGGSLGTTVTDLGNGTYQVDVCSDPDSLEPPAIGIVQPGRPPAVIRVPEFRLFVYSVKFICGEQRNDCCGCAPVVPGRYSTEINIFNPAA